MKDLTIRNNDQDAFNTGLAEGLINVEGVKWRKDEEKIFGL